MTTVQKAMTEPSSPHLSVVTPSDNPPRMLCPRSTEGGHPVVEAQHELPVSRTGGPDAADGGSQSRPEELKERLQNASASAVGASKSNNASKTPPNSPQLSPSCNSGVVAPFLHDSSSSVDGGATPNSPSFPSSQPVTMGQLKELFLAVRDAEPTAKGPAGTEASGEHNDGIKRDRASKLEYKVVNEVWNEEEYRYKIVDRVSDPDVSEWDEWIFVVRNRIDRRSTDTTIFVDIKSPPLRDILRLIMGNVGTAGLEADKPEVEQKLLYHFLPEMRDYTASDEEHKSGGVSHLRLLEDYLESAYKATAERLSSFIEHQKVTYDLLWALFKPGTLVYLDCPSTDLPMCVRFTDGVETKTSRKRDCFEIRGKYFDDDGIDFGECDEVIQIEIFRGARSIKELPAYPLELHEDPNMRQRLVSNGRKFLALRGIHHRQYLGHMFVPKDDELIQVHVDGRVMIDAASFRRINPNYPRFQDRRPVKLGAYYTVLETVDRITGNCVNPDEMEEEDLARCSPTVLGFCLDNKYWGEFALDRVKDITFSTGLFDILEISEDKKEVVRSLTESRVLEAKRTNEDDFITGKGQGVIVLLCGPPGVGKTLTAEAIAEDLQRPFYSISSGDLGSDAHSLERKLGNIFATAAAWGAILLLDEAEVYLRERDDVYLDRNRLLAVFLRVLEYYQGIFFLTTNLTQGLDSAVLDRVHLQLHYDNLKPSARRNILERYLKAAGADIQEADLEKFAKVNMNGRRIRNAVKVARLLASAKGEQLSATHVEKTIRASGYDVPPAPGSARLDTSLYDD